ncbi:CHAD domain-containing protein [Rhizobium sp. C4]|uniref:CHAD domain-containing protein n=1 Tax=Rhizobium sp. C4 TaxID=1349800 RepID=UPI001E2A2DBA|nr:CHAD domain-containing protein [Rhizobium sp. C4]MCD2175858.1 CHAD domain-containing protein [Rhizobium sp. C4]
MPKLDPRHPLSRSVPDLARHHLDAAIAELDEQRLGFDSAVHQARKHLKRVRALIRLVEHVHPKQFKPIRKALSEAARSLSEFRDAAALVECARTLAPYLAGRQVGDMAVALIEAVERRRELLAVEAPAAERLIAPVIASCRKAIAEIRSADFGHEGRAASILAEGRAENRRRAQATLKVCHHGGEPEAFHDLRKCAQATVFQAAFLSPAWPFALAAEAAEAKSLTEILGHEHDMEVLNILMHSEPHLFGAIADRDRLAELIMERRSALRHEAMEIAGRLYEESAKRDEHRFEALWKMASSAKK